ncbi:Eco57I restriction-modification methylase domain-containing protein [Lonepinella sp. MS14436]|uniref:Eco57I restriction-modification methylase domain-containing protein n=1 Tax=Lonepinella sp. MS14436 TaxID=3003619 RepID=UPI0036DA0782
MTEKDIYQLIAQQQLNIPKNLHNFILNNYQDLGKQDIARIIELANVERENHSAYYTNDFIIQHIADNLPSFDDKEEITIIEPSVGAGNFLHCLFEKYKYKKKVKIIAIDINHHILDILGFLFNKERIPANFEIEFVCDDFIYFYPNQNIDLIIGNPPFTKLNQKILSKYKQCYSFSKDLKNLAGLFLEKALSEAEYVSLIMPKNILNTPEYQQTREKIKQCNVQHILDFGELGFKGVLIETVNILVKSTGTQDKIKIHSLPKKELIYQSANYIFDDNLPYWVIYRNTEFDKVFEQLTFDLFTVFRDRQITNSVTHSQKNDDCVRVLKSRNIDNTGENIVDITDYDAFINIDKLKNLSVYSYLDRDDVYLTPNMTYNPRVMPKPKGVVVNGSVAILIPKQKMVLNHKQLNYFASDEFRQFYKIARNYQTRSLNIDSHSVFWFGINRVEMGA